jgi:hypothetical protein
LIIIDSHDLRVLSNLVSGPNRIEPFPVLTNRDLRNERHFPSRLWASDIPAIRDRSTIVQIPFDERIVLDYTLELAPAFSSRSRSGMSEGSACACRGLSRTR